jgi:DNA-binding SARP family transcriptional activator/tetratricopeptide (TPR) repeat protein
MLGVSLFGGLRLRLNGKDMRLVGRPKVALLFAYLLLNCRQPVPRDTIAFALWPDETEDAARSNLRRHLKYLRDALPDAVPWILSEGRTIQWNPVAPVEVDTVEFERRCADPALLHSAVDRYAELLPGLYDDWIVAAREHFHRAYVAAVWELALQARGRGDSASAAQYLRRILDDDPWREDALRALMVAYCEGGDRSSALQACARFELKLQHEMSVTLMPETIALRRAIECGGTLPTVPLRAAAPVQRSAPRELPFGGRDVEMAKLEHAWERTLAGAGGFAIIAGEAGIGKTRLASEFALRLEGRGRVLWGSTSLRERAPYQAITEVIRTAMSFIDPSALEMPQRALLSLLVPEIAEADRSEDSLSNAQRVKMFDAVANLLRKLAGERPTLIVLEDVHNAGPATFAMVEHLKNACAESPLLIAATARSSEAAAAAAFHRLRRPVSTAKPLVISLGPISGEASASIIKDSQMLSGRDAEARRLASTAGGHPLFLTELLNATAETGDDRDRPLSQRLHDVIAERLARLTPTSRLLLDAASVLGTEFDLEIVGEIVGWSEAQVAEAADELVARRAIRETPRAGFAFEFAHGLIATAAYEVLDDARRRRWHRRAALAASHWYASRLEELSGFVARHFELGGELEAAARHYLIAARAAADVFANDESLAYARRGLELAGDAGVLRFDLLALLEAVSERIGDRATQRVVLDELANEAQALGEPSHILEVLRRRESLHRYFGEFAQARQAIGELKLLAAGDARWEATALRDEAVLLVDAGSRNEAYDVVAAAAARAADAEDRRLLVSVLTLQAHIAAALGRNEEARVSLQRADEAAESDGSLLLRMRVAYTEMTVRMLFQEHDEVVRAAPRLLELADRVSDREIAAGTHAMVGGAFVHLFNVASARRHLNRAFALYRDADVNGAAIALNNLATLELDVGRLDRVDRALEATQQFLEQSDCESQYECLDLLRCDVDLQRFHYDAALKRADDLVERAAARQNILLEGEGWRCVGVALKGLGRAAQAIAVLERAVELLWRIGAVDSAVRASAQLAHASALGGDPRALSLAEEALRRLIEARTAIPPSAFWTVARAFAEAGCVPEYRTTLVRAHEQFVSQERMLRAAADRAAFAALPGNAELLRAFTESVGLAATQLA